MAAFAGFRKVKGTVWSDRNLMVLALPVSTDERYLFKKIFMYRAEDKRERGQYLGGALAYIITHDSGLSGS